MRATIAFAVAIAALSLTLADRSVLAQDVAPETPPELRDFRLDRPSVQPAAQPTVEPAPVTSPPATATVPDSEMPARTPAPTPRRTPSPVASTTVSEAPIGDTAGVPPVATRDMVTVDDQAIEEARPRPLAVPPSFPSSQYWGQIVGGLGLIGIVLIVFLFRRSRKRAVQSDNVEELVTAAEPPIASVPVQTATKAVQLNPRLTIDFIPEKASISFTALTIKGELHIINESDSAAKNMQLRAALISASADQEAEISGFHHAAPDTQPQSLGDAQAGERIGMGIELTVPLADLQSFPLGNQRLFVPIIVGNIAYSDEAGTVFETAKIACIIGREANPPKPRMAPLRLDLGPRSFSPLGQRPLLT